jgi:hypothetical protein
MGGVTFLSQHSSHTVYTMSKLRDRLFSNFHEKRWRLFLTIISLTRGINLNLLVLNCCLVPTLLSPFRRRVDPWPAIEAAYDNP